jgi:hypothetical protein
MRIVRQSKWRCIRRPQPVGPWDNKTGYGFQARRGPRKGSEVEIAASYCRPRPGCVYFWWGPGKQYGGLMVLPRSDFLECFEPNQKPPTST